jgi:hypothetical protein
MLFWRPPAWARVRRGLAWLVLLTIAVAPGLAVHAAPAASAPGPGGQSTTGPSCASPPCGYIVPFVTLSFPNRPRCDLTDAGIAGPHCTPPPGQNASLVYDGVVTYSWRESEDLTYPVDPNQPIVISFSGIATNPAWLSYKMEPDKLTLTQADMANPQNYRPDQSGGTTPVVWFWYNHTLKLTLTTTRAPDADELRDLETRSGVQDFYIKAKTTPSGNFYQAGFGGSQFRFNGTGLLGTLAASGSTTSSPAWGVAGPAATLVIAAVAGRRRQSTRMR